MYKGRNLFLKISLGLIAVLVLYMTAQGYIYDNDTQIIVFDNGTVFSVMIADDNNERQQGLSGKESLGEHEGMLFIFDTLDNHRFWMKDMNFPIDIIWIDSNWQVVDITRNVSPDTFPNSFAPMTPAQYVLEVPAGSASVFSIGVGNTVILQ